MSESVRSDQDHAYQETPLVHLIETDPSTRETVCEMLRQGGFDFQAFSSTEEYLANPTTESACLLLDYRLAKVDFQQRIAEKQNPLSIVLIGGEDELAETVRFLEQGAATLLTKPFEANQLADTVRRAIESGTIRAKVRARFEEIGSSVDQLSAREKTVLQAIVSGQLNKAIARSLDVSVRTIEGDRAKIVDKFNAETTGEVVGKYAQYSLLSEMGSLAGLCRVR